MASHLVLVRNTLHLGPFRTSLLFLKRKRWLTLKNLGGSSLDFGFRI
jgi:hypothetical protein